MYVLVHSRYTRAYTRNHTGASSLLAQCMPVHLFQRRILTLRMLLLGTRGSCAPYLDAHRSRASVRAYGVLVQIVAPKHARALAGCRPRPFWGREPLSCSYIMQHSGVTQISHCVTNDWDKCDRAVGRCPRHLSLLFHTRSVPAVTSPLCLSEV